MRLLTTFRSTVIVSLQTPRNWSPVWQLALNGFVAGWPVIVFVLIQLRRNSSGSAHHVALTCFLPVCLFGIVIQPSQSVRDLWVIVDSYLSLSTRHPNHQRVLLLSASATTCSMISDHGCCSRSSSSNDSQPSRLLQQSACWSTYWPNITSTVSFTCGRSTCARPAWSCSSVSSHAWHVPLVEFPTACHVQVMSADIQVCMVWHPTTCCASALYWPSFLAVLCYIHLTQTNCWYHSPARPALDCVSSGPTAWNDMPTHLRNLDLPLSNFRQLLKTTVFQTDPV